MRSSSLTSSHRQKASLAEGSKPLYPGLGLPLREYSPSAFKFPFYPIGAHGSCYNSLSLPLPVREVAMMSVMETLTDKPDWHIKVNDKFVVSKWRDEALALPNMHWWRLACDIEDPGPWHRIEGQAKVPENIMSGDAFDCCIQELRSKAKFFEKSGMVPTLDAHGVVVKSDSLVSVALHEALLSSFETLRADQADAPDWHPKSGDRVQNLVHPSLYPLVYNRTRVVQDDVVGVEEAIDEWSGRGEVLVGEEPWVPQGSEHHNYGVGGYVPPDFWSVNFQWLPSNFTFRDDGTVRFASYINNLHPNKYPEIYRAIERLIESSLPMWDQCLKVAADFREVTGPGRNGGRFGVPDDPDDENRLNWDPSDPELCADADVDAKTLEEYGWEGEEEYTDASERQKYLSESKWMAERKPLLPSPSFKDVNYEITEGQRLFDKFRNSGLQVIVKMASVELTPEKPDFPHGSWHVEGQLNENICATALYYVDSDNVTESSLSFRMQTSAYLNDEETGFSVGQDAYHWMESIYGTEFGSGGGACLQNYGTVQTKEKRLLAFPNVFQHRVSPFKLVDPTKPGRRRFIALWLVDPNKRIISTANVPPQQLSWWAESLIGKDDAAVEDAPKKTSLPPEIVRLLQENGVQMPISSVEGKLPEEALRIIQEHSSKNSLPMSLEEAKEHRLKLMDERGVHQIRSETSWQQHSYGFCEH